jgi:hypothetical protein
MNLNEKISKRRLVPNHWSDGSLPQAEGADCQVSSASILAGFSQVFDDRGPV